MAKLVQKQSTKRIIHRKHYMAEMTISCSHHEKKANYVIVIRYVYPDKNVKNVLLKIRYYKKEVAG